jgi:putative chitinase
MITRAQLDTQWPHADAALKDGIIAGQSDAYALADLTTPLRLAHFWAQASHECGAGIEMEENLNYSAKRLTEVWPKRFPTLMEAQLYAHNPQALAIKVYGGRMGNLPAPSTDGFAFIGRGLLQETGRDEYTAVGSAIGLDLINYPQWASSPDYALKVACGSWKIAGCNPAADADNLALVTRRINGGLIGLDQRAAWLAKWKRELEL